MIRKIKRQVKGYRTIDGAGVNLVRVLGNRTVEDYDPILMLDSFDSTNPKDYTAGFPMHPHRGIETISYVYKGSMVHRDSLGNSDEVSNGEIQWMTAGSGIMHEEMVPAADRLLGVQLWLNLPAKDKMTQPDYHKVGRDDIKEIDIDGGMIRLLAGNYKEHEGYKSKYLPLDYYDIHLKKGASFEMEVDEDASIMLFTLIGEIYIEGELVEEKTAVKLSEGNTIKIKAGDQDVQVLYMKSIELKEPVAWAGPIVMNTAEEIQRAYFELDKGTFVKEKISY